MPLFALIVTAKHSRVTKISKWNFVNRFIFFYKNKSEEFFTQILFFSFS